MRIGCIAVALYLWSLDKFLHSYSFSRNGAVALEERLLLEVMTTFRVYAPWPSKLEDQASNVGLLLLP